MSPPLFQISHASILTLSQISHIPSASFSPILFGDQGPSSFLTSAIGAIMPSAGGQELQSSQWKPHSVVGHSANTCCASGPSQELKAFWRIKPIKKCIIQSPSHSCLSENSSVGGGSEHPSHPRVVPSGPSKSSQMVGMHSLHT